MPIYAAAERPMTGGHEEPERSMVLARAGCARVGEEESCLEPETCFVTPTGTPCGVKLGPEPIPLRARWSHGARPLAAWPT